MNKNACILFVISLMITKGRYLYKLLLVYCLLRWYLMFSLSTYKESGNDYGFSDASSIIIMLSSYRFVRSVMRSISSRSSNSFLFKLLFGNVNMLVLEATNNCKSPGEGGLLLGLTSDFKPFLDPSLTIVLLALIVFFVQLWCLLCLCALWLELLAWMFLLVESVNR